MEEETNEKKMIKISLNNILIIILLSILFILFICWIFSLLSNNSNKSNVENIIIGDGYYDIRYYDISENHGFKNERLLGDIEQYKIISTFDEYKFYYEQIYNYKFRAEIKIDTNNIYKGEWIQSEDIKIQENLKLLDSYINEYTFNNYDIILINLEKGQSHSRCA